MNEPYIHLNMYLFLKHVLQPGNDKATGFASVKSERSNLRQFKFKDHAL